MELDKTSEARRKAQRNGEEDPVVVAQRFLNIYRQLHIFNAEKKAAFNKMLLELPPQIRGMFGQLPGGALLQDYVDELAEKEGIAKSAPAQPLDIAEDDVKQAKILATALAEAQVQATAKMQEMGVQPAPAAAPLGSAGIQPQTAPMAAPAATTAKLAMDKTFAQEFATVLAAAMQKNSANQEVEIKNIINTLGQTQLEIIKVLQEENTEHREEMKNISRMMLQAQEQINSVSATAGQTPQTPKISEETKQLIRILLDGQKQLIERVAQVETIAARSSEMLAQKEAPAKEKAPQDEQKQQAEAARPVIAIGQEVAAILEKSEQNFSRMISALNERQKNDTLEIARLINESQQSLVQMMVQHNTLNQNSGNAAAANNNANNIQINTVDYSGVLNQIADRLANLQPAAVPTVQETAPVQAANIQINFPEQAIGEIVKAQSQLYREIAAEQTKELSAIITLALKESQKASTQNIIDALSVRPIIIQQANEGSAAVPNPVYAKASRPIPQGGLPADEMIPFSRTEQSQVDPIDLFGEDDTVDRPVPQPTSEASAHFVFNEGSSEAETEPDLSEPYGEETEAAAETAEFTPVFAAGEPESMPDDGAETETAQATNAELTAAASKKKKKRKKKKKKNANENLTESELPAVSAVPDINAADTDILPVPEEEIGAEDFSEPAENMTAADADIAPDMDAAEGNTDSLFEERDSDTVPAESDNLDTPNNNNLWFDGDIDEDPQSGNNDVIPAPSLPEEFDSPDDWGFTPAAESRKSALEDTGYSENPAAGFSQNAETGQDWEWVYEEDPAAEFEDSGEGTEWEWEYVPEDAPATAAAFRDENLCPLSDKNPICSGDLFFQEQVFTPQPITNSIIGPYLDHMPGILDSAAADQSADPYQNSARKD